MSSTSSTDKNERESWPRRLRNRISARLFAGTEWFRGPDTLDEALFKLNTQLGLAQDTSLSDESKETLKSVNERFAHNFQPTNEEHVVREPEAKPLDEADVSKHQINVSRKSQKRD